MFQVTWPGCATGDKAPLTKPLKLKEVASITVCYVTPIKRIREQRVSAHLFIYSFLLFKLLLGFGLDFEFGLGLTLGLDLGLEFGLGLGLGLELELVRVRIAIFLFLRNVTAAAA